MGKHSLVLDGSWRRRGILVDSCRDGDGHYLARCQVADVHDDRLGRRWISDGDNPFRALHSHYVHIHGERINHLDASGIRIAPVAHL
jgi:hypothetical protein